MNAFEEFGNLISSINIEPSYVILVFIIMLVFIIEIILIKKGMLNFKVNEKRMQKAIKLNHIVKAKRISYYDDATSGTEVDSWYHAKYEYQIDGKKGIYKYLSRKHPSSEITLYYINNSKKLFHYEEKTSILFLLIYIIPFIIAIIIMNLLGIEIK